jgi:glycosyltransferase involved in cell wall biosynthesis
VIITFLCPSSPQPIGGVTAIYEFANGLARRGHEVHLAHWPFFGQRIESMDDIAWFRFEPTIRHHIHGISGGALPHGDIFFGRGSDPEVGQPVLLVQGFEMLYQGLERQGFRTPCLKIAIASWLVQAAARYGVQEDQFRVVFMGINRERYRLTAPIDDRPLQVALLHSTHPAKGWKVAREALEIAHELRPDLRAVAFGTSAPAEALPPWLSVVVDPAQEELVERIYNRSRVFLQASDYEGFGFTAVEAMACGCALVTTDNGGSRDYAHHEDTALVAPPGDAEGLARHVVRLLDDDALRQRIATAGNRYVERFDWDRAAAELEHHLEVYLEDPARFQREPGPELSTGVEVDAFDLR